MTDLLTTKEAEQAAQQGWQLCHVFDAATSKWLVEVLPTKDSKVHSAKRMQATVLGLARERDVVALRAMSLVMASHAPQTPKAKRKKK